jgi:hypothetical protein
MDNSGNSDLKRVPRNAPVTELEVFQRPGMSSSQYVGEAPTKDLAGPISLMPGQPEASLRISQQKSAI